METVVDYDNYDYYDAVLLAIFSYNLKCNGDEENINECLLKDSEEICVSKAKAAVVCNSTVVKFGIF